MKKIVYRRRSEKLSISLDTDIAQWVRDEANNSRRSVSSIVQEYLLPAFRRDKNMRDPRATYKPRADKTDTPTGRPK